jgi:hypothetical protein
MPFTTAVIVLGPAPVELRVPVATPVAFVGPGCVIAFPFPVADSTTVAPLIGFPPASRAVTVMVLALDPVLAEIVVGAATTEVCDAETIPEVTLNALDTSLWGTLDALAVSRYPVPTLSRLTPAKLATPFTAATDPPPLRVAPLGLLLSVSVTLFVAVLSRFPNWS